MSLSGALNIGKSALAVQQAAIQVTGNNIANAGNADFTRQAASITPSGDRQMAPGVFIGTGVNLDAVRRQIDEALESRLRGSVSDNNAADLTEQWLGRVEAVFNELGDDDLSTRLSTFFGSWSNLANKPQDMGMRQVVLQEGAGVASWFNQLRNQFGDGLVSRNIPMPISDVFIEAVKDDFVFSSIRLHGLGRIEEIDFFALSQIL